MRTPVPRRRHRRRASDRRSATRCASGPALASAPALSPAAAAAHLKRRARDLGFDAVGIAAVTPLEAAEHYAAWLDAGRHGEMHYLASLRHRERRADPERVLSGLRSVVCVAMC